MILPFDQRGRNQAHAPVISRDDNSVAVRLIHTKRRTENPCR